MLARLMLALALTGALGCGSKVLRKPPPVPMDGESVPAPKNDAYLDDVKKAVADQLECPVADINVICIRRDTLGECIAVRGDGCERLVEYQFGES